MLPIVSIIVENTARATTSQQQEPAKMRHDLSGGAGVMMRTTRRSRGDLRHAASLVAALVS